MINKSLLDRILRVCYYPDNKAMISLVSHAAANNSLKILGKYEFF